ncbi:hypothetical protein CRUP_038737 [Coryphaenoides rupestris]|nr:hypothetical protein CRUP_038737 [Coryphaenoides rupestris]
MAVALKEEQQLAQKVYAALEAASCPLVVGVHLQEADSMHHLLCTPSEHRMAILAWICKCINPNLKNVKVSAIQPEDPNVQIEEMALLGRELMLCKADDLDLIQCKFLHSECQNPAVFSPCALRVAVSDLRQLTAAFSRVYETDFKDYCNREAPRLRTETLIFHRVHGLLLACNTELKMLEEVSQATTAVTENACQLQTQQCYWSHGEKRTLPDQLKTITRQYKNFLSQPSA